MQFDIRQWLVLKVKPHPCEVWFYEEFYARVCPVAVDDAKAMQATLAKHSFLANLSISKSFEGAHQFNEHVLSMRELNLFLSEQFPEESDPCSRIQQRMKAICGQFMYGLVKDGSIGQFRVLGLDFVVTEGLDVYLLEVNASPSMNAGCQATDALIAEFQSDQAKLFWDYKLCSKTQQLHSSTGKFTKLSPSPFN